MLEIGLFMMVIGEFYILIRLISALAFIGLCFIFGFLSIISLYAKNIKFFIYSLPFLVPSVYAAYLSILWTNLHHIFFISIYVTIAGLIVFTKISEPEIGLLDRFLPPSILEKRGKFYAAARKYEKIGKFEDAARCYENIGMLESAAYAYEKSGLLENAAECYEKLSKKDPEYIKDASYLWKKSGNLRKAAELLERYAEIEEWYLEDAAKLWEKVDGKKSKILWQKLAEYYEKEAQEEGVFYEDAAKAYEKVGNIKKAKEMYRKFVEYCRNQAKYDKAWIKYIEETENKLKLL